MKAFPLISILLFCTVYTNINAQRTYSIKGKVIDGEMGIPLKNAIVTLQSGNKTIVDSTDFYGMFYFDSIKVIESINLLIQKKALECNDGYIAVNKSYKESELQKNDTLVIALSNIKITSNFPMALFKENESKVYSLKNIQLSTTEVITNIIDKSSLGKLKKLMDCDYSIKLLIQGNISENESRLKIPDLGIKRAESLKKILVEYGIPSDRIITKDYGTSRIMYTDGELKRVKDSEEKSYKTFLNQSAVIQIIKRQ